LKGKLAKVILEWHDGVMWQVGDRGCGLVADMWHEGHEYSKIV